MSSKIKIRRNKDASKRFVLCSLNHSEVYGTHGSGRRIYVFLRTRTTIQSVTCFTVFAASWYSAWLNNKTTTGTKQDSQHGSCSPNAMAEPDPPTLLAAQDRVVSSEPMCVHFSPIRRVCCAQCTALKAVAGHWFFSFRL